MADSTGNKLGINGLQSFRVLFGPAPLVSAFWLADPPWQMPTSLIWSLIVFTSVVSPASLLRGSSSRVFFNEVQGNSYTSGSKRRAASIILLCESNETWLPKPNVIINLSTL